MNIPLKVNQSIEKSQEQHTPVVYICFGSFNKNVKYFPMDMLFLDLFQ